MWNCVFPQKSFPLESIPRVKRKGASFRQTYSNNAEICTTLTRLQLVCHALRRTIYLIYCILRAACTQRISAPDLC